MRRAAAGRARRLLEFARTQSFWLRPFSVLLGLFFFGDLAAAAAVSSAGLQRGCARPPARLHSLLVSARLLFSGLAAFVSGAPAMLWPSG